MKVSELIALSEIQSEESYDDPTWISYINAGLDDLTPVVKLLKSKKSIAAATNANGEATIAISGDTDLSKSHEFLKLFFTPGSGTIRELRRLPYSDNYSEGWKLDSDNITIKATVGSDAGAKARVDYYQKLQHVSTAGDDIASVTGLPEQYHHLLLHYCVDRSQQKEEELNDKADAFQEYILGKNNMAIDRIWIMEPHMRKFIKRARVAAAIGGTAQ